MSAQQSNLSAASYGYDFVVATTQASINATMKAYLNSLQEPVANICYVADAHDNPVPIDYQKLLTLTDGIDPFTLPDDCPTSDSRFQALMDARFLAGFRAQLGIPPGYAPTAVPDVVTLGSDTASVTYNMMCAQFTVVQLTPGGGYSPAAWMSQSQPSGAAWLFTSKVDLRLSVVDQRDYQSLPAAVRQQIANMGPAAFSIQQLLFDLDNAALETIPEMSGVTNGSVVQTCLTTYFMDLYFKQMKANGEPVLGCTVLPVDAPKSTLTLTGLDMEVGPFVDANGQPVAAPTDEQAALYTLNYLCAANNKNLPPAVPFKWNWIEPGEEADYDGVIAINRATFAQYLHDQLIANVMQNSFLPWVRVSSDGTGANYYWRMTPGQQPIVTFPTSGSTVLTFSYSGFANDSTGAGGDVGQMTLAPNYTLTVSFDGTSITIVQHLTVRLRIQVYQENQDGNVIDIQYTDVYALAVGQSGKLTATPTSTTVDNSHMPTANGFYNFFTDINQLIDDAAGWVQNYAKTNLSDIPVSVAQNFVFPGGNTFAFKDVAFSDTGDLVSHISYVDQT